VTPLRALRAVAAAGVLALAGLLVWHLTHQPKSVAGAVAKGKIVKAPAFDLPRLDANGKLSLASLRGKAVVLNFWQSDCQPCKQEMPRLEAAYRRWQAKDLVVVGVDMLDTRSAGRAFRKRYGATYPMVFDHLGDTAAPFGVWNTPQTFFLDRHGRILERVLGPISTSAFDENARRALAA
jgi:peroxiredoxin